MAERESFFLLFSFLFSLKQDEIKQPFYEKFGITSLSTFLQISGVHVGFYLFIFFSVYNFLCHLMEDIYF